MLFVVGVNSWHSYLLGEVELSEWVVTVGHFSIGGIVFWRTVMAPEHRLLRPLKNKDEKGPELPNGTWKVEKRLLQNRSVAVWRNPHTQKWFHKKRRKKWKLPKIHSLEITP
jgi:hypothetical protein